LRYVVHHVRSTLGLGDIVFRHGLDGLIVFVHDGATEKADAVARQMRERVRSGLFSFSSGDRLSVDVEVTRLSGRGTGESIGDLVASARLRKAESTDTDKPSIH
jgi:GGDEF domain-containing protein